MSYQVLMNRKLLMIRVRMVRQKEFESISLFCKLINYFIVVFLFTNNEDAYSDVFSGYQTDGMLKFSFTLICSKNCIIIIILIFVESMATECASAFEDDEDKVDLTQE